MDDITHCIADAQYGMALKDRNGTLKPLDKIRSPPESEYESYVAKFNFDLDFALDNPIALYFLEQYGGKDVKGLSEFLIFFDRFKKMEDIPDDAVDQILGEAKKLPKEYQRMVVNIQERINGFESYQKTPMGRLPSIRVRPLVSFGGLSVHDNYANHEGEIVSAIEVEVLDEANEELTEAEIALDAKRMVESKRRSILRQEAIAAFENLEQLLRQKVDVVIQRFKDSPEFRKMVNGLWYSEQRLTVNDFQVFRDLGRGAFGVVSSAKLKSTGALVAIKCVNRRLIKGKKALKLISVEKKILQKLGENPSHFTIWLKYAFQDKDFLYLALPLCSGGDLGFHLKKRVSFSVERARFHIAETLLGLAHLHSLGIVYRDLKPENLILDEQGHTRISDLGLAVVTGGRRVRGRAGTPGYWAPEVIKKQHYSFSADYWSLGVCLYEFIVGICPFSKSYTGMERDEATLNWKIRFPRTIGKHDVPFPTDAEDLIVRLLDRDKLSRAGAGERGSEEIKAHPFFHALNWWKLAERKIPSKWVPNQNLIHAANQIDLENANNEREYRKVKLGPEDEIPDFDYISRYAHQMDIVEVYRTEKAGKLKIEPLYDVNCCTTM